MSYTGVLNMLDLAEVPVLAKERTGLWPIVVAGGPCACNPEPLADFVDLFILGEGEEVNLEIIDLYMQAKTEGWDKQHYLKRGRADRRRLCARACTTSRYNADGTIHAVTPNWTARPPRSRSGSSQDLDKVFFPEKFVVPFIDIVHDRAMLEVHARLHPRLPLLPGGIYLPARCGRKALRYA